MTWSWLERERERQMAELELEEMLAEFVATGLVLEHRGKGARTYYRMNPRKVSEIRALLKGGRLFSSPKSKCIEA